MMTRLCTTSTSRPIKSAGLLEQPGRTGSTDGFGNVTVLSDMGLSTATGLSGMGH